MSARELILVRHGVTDWNEDGRLMGRADIDVNTRGREQAERVAALLSEWEHPIAAVYASPQLRTRSTAEPIAAALGLTATIEEGLDEVWLSSQWQGKTVADLRGDRDLERIIEDPLHRCEAIEPVADVQKRAVAAADALAERHDGERIVLVSHGDPLRVIVAHYLALELASFRRLACDNGSVTAIRVNRRGPRLELLNWVPRP